jgi:hypothetical protein
LTTLAAPSLDGVWSGSIVLFRTYAWTSASFLEPRLRPIGWAAPQIALVGMRMEGLVFLVNTVAMQLASLWFPSV